MIKIATKDKKIRKLLVEWWENNIWISNISYNLFSLYTLYIENLAKIYKSILELLKTISKEHDISELYNDNWKKDEYLKYMSDIWNILETDKIELTCENTYIANINLALKIYY